ncbi:MAG: rhomboid family intramembrane serine protease [Gammaproteobacteria bacterium]|nr:rhomboid family intramembrane serine protease [Gammaproteobacteria bacterium]
MVAVIPLNDASRRPARLPWVTLAIIATNVLVFVLELQRGDEFVARWSVIPAQILAGHGLATLLTAMFLHGGWLHITSNMVFLWAFGAEVEQLMTPARYLTFYLLGGIAAMVTQVAATPDSTVPALGASGAVAAVMGAFLVSYPRDRMRSLLVVLVFVRVTYIPAALLIGVWFLIQFFSLRAGSAASSGVAYAAHVGGFIFGVVTTRLFAARVG